jgi:hypothetical protein
MQTAQVPVTGYGAHASMGQDAAMPDNVSGGMGSFEIPGSGTGNLYLFDAYAEAMCIF